MKFNKSPVVLCVLILMFVSCSDDEGVNDSVMAISMRDAPLITGFYITSNSPESEGIWGVPSGPIIYSSNYRYYQFKKPGDPPDPGVIPCCYNLYIPYPNPFTEKVNIIFNFPEANEYQVWVVRGYTSSELNILDATENELGIATVQVNYAPGIVACGYSEAGSYHVEITFKEKGALLYPYGFYRIYIQAGEFFDWADMYFTSEEIAERFHD